jgi:hypothetical protein
VHHRRSIEHTSASVYLRTAGGGGFGEINFAIDEEFTSSDDVETIFVEVKLLSNLGFVQSLDVFPYFWPSNLWVKGEIRSFSFKGFGSMVGQTPRTLIRCATA